MKTSDPVVVGFRLMLQLRRILCIVIWLSLFLFGFEMAPRLRADDATSNASEKSSVTDDDKAAGPKIAPDKFSDVDKLTSLTVVTLLVCVVGVVALLALIVVGARRIRRMTRSPLLKSKYDELELLREKYRREVEGLETPPPKSRENRR